MSSPCLELISPKKRTLPPGFLGKCSQTTSMELLLSSNLLSCRAASGQLHIFAGFLFPLQRKHWTVQRCICINKCSVFPRVPQGIWWSGTSSWSTVGSMCAWWRQRWTVWPLLQTSLWEVRRHPSPASPFPPYFVLITLETADLGGSWANPWFGWGDEWLWVQLCHSDLQLWRITGVGWSLIFLRKMRSWRL